LEVGNHGIFFYEDPHEKREVLFSFLQAGLEKGEDAFCVATQETSAQICRHMEDFGLNVQSLRSIEGLDELVGSGAQAITKWVVMEMHSKMGIV